MSAKKTNSPYIAVGKSGIHSAGVFAKTFIPKGARIIEYVGERITKAQSHIRADIPLSRHKKDKTKGAVYIFELNKRCDIDGNVPYNTAKFINHSCEPNCESEVIRGKVWIITLKDIQPGEEITYNYGYGYDAYEDHPCHCGSEQCIGYILAAEQWWKLKRKRNMEKKRAQMKKDVKQQA